MLCSTIGKKNPSEFPYPSPQYSKRSPKQLLCCCFTAVNLRRTKGTRVFRHSQPSHCQQSSLQSLCAMHKNTSGDSIKADLTPFLPHTYQCACARITKIAANSSSDLKYGCPIYLPNHLQEEVRTCSSHPFSLVLTLCIYITTARICNKSLLTHTYVFPCPTERAASAPVSPHTSNGKSVCGQGGGNSHEQKP